MTFSLTILFICCAFFCCCIIIKIRGRKNNALSEVFLAESKIWSINDYSVDSLNKMHNLGAKIIFSCSIHTHDKAFLTDKALCLKLCGGLLEEKIVCQSPPSLHGKIKCSIHLRTTAHTTTKNKSVIGRAVVGGALAGGAGAAVGAASALSGGGTKTVTTYSTGNYHFWIGLGLGLGIVSKGMIADKLYISKKLIEKLGYPKLPSAFDEENSPYSTYDISDISKLHKEEIIKYIEKAINIKSMNKINIAIDSIDGVYIKKISSDNSKTIDTSIQISGSNYSSSDWVADGEIQWFEKDNKISHGIKEKTKNAPYVLKFELVETGINVTGFPDDLYNGLYIKK